MNVTGPVTDRSGVPPPSPPIIPPSPAVEPTHSPARPSPAVASQRDPEPQAESTNAQNFAVLGPVDATHLPALPPLTQTASLSTNASPTATGLQVTMNAPRQPASARASPSHLAADIRSSRRASP